MGGGLKPSLCDTVESRCLLMWKQLAHTVSYSKRNEGIIILIMSDTQICKHPQFNMCACENFISSPLIFLSVVLFLLISPSSPPVGCLVPNSLPVSTVLYCLPPNRNSLFGGLKLLRSPLSQHRSWSQSFLPFPLLSQSHGQSDREFKVSLSKYS